MSRALLISHLLRRIDNLMEIILQIRYLNFDFDTEMVFTNLRHSFSYHPKSCKRINFPSFTPSKSV